MVAPSIAGQERGEWRREHAAIRQYTGNRYGCVEPPLRGRMIRLPVAGEPTQPVGLWSWPFALVIVAVALCVVALVSFWIGRYHSTAARIVWTIVVILIPVLGPIAWFLLGWERRG
jgi:hypothetical protein